MTPSESLITLTGGVIVPVSVITRLLDLEGRGAKFHLLDDGRFKVDPVDVLTSADVDFLRAHRDQARQAIVYSERQAPQ